jgi:hypothetical protein
MRQRRHLSLRRAVQRFLGSLLMLVPLCGLMLGCGSRDPEPTAPGYSEGPMKSKAETGKTAGGMPGGNPPP